jgi:hypothetical protein
MTQAFEDHQIRQYLLGDLPAREETELEEAYFSDSELLARVELARDDLTDDYAAGRLTAADREKFERRVLATHEGREQLAVARALRQAGAAAPASSPAEWRLDRRWMGLAAGVLLAIGAIFAWRFFSTPGPEAERRDVSAQPPTATSPPTAPGHDSKPSAGDPSRGAPIVPATTLATLVLTADLDRSKGVPPTLLLSTGATDVDLVAPATGLKAGPARAHVESIDGKSVWSGAVPIPAAESPDSRPRARVPVSALPPGDYFFSIEPAGSGDSPKYYFRVRAQ